MEIESKLLNSVDRVFQFVMIVMLFLPNIWDDAQSSLPQDVLNVITKSSVGIIIGEIFLAYLIFELFRDILSKNSSVLRIIEMNLLVLAFGMVTVVGEVYSKKNTFNLPNIFYEAIIALIPWFTVSLIFTVIIGISAYYYKKFFKNN